MHLLLTSIVFFRISDWTERLPDGLITLMSRLNRGLKWVLFFVLLAVIGTSLVSRFVTPGTLEADMSKMSNQELREVSGKSLLNFTIHQGNTNVTRTAATSCGWYSCNTSYQYNIDNTDQTFLRLKLDMELKVDPDRETEDAIFIDGAKIGHYPADYTIGDDQGGFLTGGLGNAAQGESFYFGPNLNGNDGCSPFGADFGDRGGGCSNNVSGGGSPNDGWDIEGSGIAIQPGNSDGGVGQTTDVKIQGPYVEFAYENYNSDGSEKLTGVRVGFDKIQGALGIDNISAISGTLAAQDFGTAGGCQEHGHRMTYCEATLNALNLFNAAIFGSNGSAFGDNDGWTEDFWISFNTQDMFWRYRNEAANGGGSRGDAIFNTDGEGFWIHATDDVEGGLS